MNGVAAWPTGLSDLGSRIFSVGSRLGSRFYFAEIYSVNGGAKRKRKKNHINYTEFKKKNLKIDDFHSIQGAKTKKNHNNHTYYITLRTSGMWKTVVMTDVTYRFELIYTRF